jgi:hypothetical protein
MNNTILFSIYTGATGHNIVSFPWPAFTDCQDIFQKAAEYAQMTYNDPNDVPQLFMLTEIPMTPVTLKTPSEWEIDTGIKIIDNDGWRRSSTHGEKAWETPITEKEFRDRSNDCTVMPESFNR